MLYNSLRNSGRPFSERLGQLCWTEPEFSSSRTSRSCSQSEPVLKYPEFAWIRAESISRQPAAIDQTREITLLNSSARRGTAPLLRGLVCGETALVALWAC